MAYPEKHRDKFNQTISMEIYQQQIKRFKFVNYQQIMDLYKIIAEKNAIESTIFS